MYAVGLPWLTVHDSSIVAGVGRDAEYIAQHIVEKSCPTQRGPVKATFHRVPTPAQGQSKSTDVTRPAGLNHSVTHAWSEGVASCQTTSSAGTSNTNFTH